MHCNTLTWNSCVSEGRKKNLVVRHVVKYHRDPLFKLRWRKKWIILIQGVAERRIFLSEDLKINASPWLLSWETTCKPAVLLLWNYNCRSVAGYLTQRSKSESKSKKLKTTKNSTFILHISLCLIIRCAILNQVHILVGWPVFAVVQSSCCLLRDAQACYDNQLYMSWKSNMELNHVT